MRLRDRLASLGSHAVLVVASIIAVYPALWVLKMALTPSQAFDSSPSPLPRAVSGDNFVEVTTTTMELPHPHLVHRLPPWGWAVLAVAAIAGLVVWYLRARPRRRLAAWRFGVGGVLALVLLLVADWAIWHWQWLFGRQVLNSVLVSGATTGVGIVVSCTAAYAFSRFRFPGRELGLGALLLTQIFPGVVMVIPLYILLDKLHLVNSLLGLVLVYSTTAVPFCTWMLKGYFDTIPADMEESALVDGASRWTIFWRITLPLARPALAVTALFSFMTAWNEFILAYTFLNDAGLFTLPVALQRHVGEHSTDWGLFASGAILVSLPVMALFYALQKHLVGGLTAGSVKG